MAFVGGKFDRHFRGLGRGADGRVLAEHAAHGRVVVGTRGGFGTARRHASMAEGQWAGSVVRRAGIVRAGAGVWLVASNSKPAAAAVDFPGPRTHRRG